MLELEAREHMEYISTIFWINQIVKKIEFVNDDLICEFCWFDKQHWFEHDYSANTLCCHK